MSKFIGFFLSVAAIGLLSYGHPAGVDVVAAYAWVVVALSIVASPFFVFADSSRTFGKRAEAVKATSKPRLAWAFVRIVFIGGGLAFHGLVVTAAFYMIFNGLLVMVINAAAEARLKNP